MKIYDVSLTISEDMVVWPGDPKVAINKKRSIDAGDSCNVSQLDMGSHTGTHIDAPYHFENDGSKIDKLSLKTLIGKARLFDVGADKDIGLEKVKTFEIKGLERVLFKSSNSNGWKTNAKLFNKNYVAVTKEAAAYLVDAGIKLVGVDYLSVEKYGNKAHETHHTLLENGIIVVEGLSLADVTPGDYELIALPLKIKNGDGSPARVILRSL